MDRSVNRRLIVAAALSCATVPGARAQDAAPPHWEVTVGVRVGSPQGWVQVRESAISGTRLGYGPDLGVRRVHSYAVRVARTLGARTTLDVTVESMSLDGATTLANDIQFNGATLARGTVLRTRTDFPHFLRIDATVGRTLIAFGNGGGLTVHGGLTFVALSFVLKGTLAPGSALHETSEDFVTQELPVPIVDAALVVPVFGGVHLVGAVGGGYLPRVNSLRREGGEVTLAQSAFDVSTLVRVTLTRSLRLDVGWLYSSFAQRENSAEDGNDIAFAASTAVLRLSRRF